MKINKGRSKEYQLQIIVFINLFTLIKPISSMYHGDSLSVSKNS